MSHYHGDINSYGLISANSWKAYSKLTITISSLEDTRPDWCLSVCPLISCSDLQRIQLVQGFSCIIHTLCGTSFLQQTLNLCKAGAYPGQWWIHTHYYFVSPLASCLPKSLKLRQNPIHFNSQRWNLPFSTRITYIHRGKVLAFSMENEKTWLYESNK
jgi:hypothetical protein